MTDGTALQEKVYAAEKNVASVRLAVILLNSIVYAFLLDKAGTIPALAYAVIGIANTYAVFVLLVEPYRRFPLMLSSYFTTGADAALIALWIYATGTYESPFYVVWYVSIAAVAFRFPPRVTVAASILYAAVYLGLVYGAGEAAGRGATLTVRAAYILLVGAVGALLSREATSQIAVRVRMQERMREATEAEARLRSVIEGAPEAVFILDDDLRVLDANSRTEAMFQLLRTDLRGVDVAQWLPTFTDGHGMQDGGTGTLARRRDGQRFPVEVRATRLSGPGPGRQALFVRDLSESRGPEDDLRVVQSIALAASEASTVDEALQTTIERTCTATDWAVGEVWLPRPDGARLELRSNWHRPEPDLAQFVEATRRVDFGPGVGIPGQTWATGRTVWVADITAHTPPLPRAALAQQAGLRAGVGVPVLVDGRVAAVLAFYMRRAHPTDQRMARLVDTVAAQLATLLQRKAAEQELRRVSRHHELILKSAGEGILEIDRDGHATYANDAAARMLGWSPQDLRGAFLHDRIHPTRTDGKPCQWATCPIHDSLAQGVVQRTHDELFQRRDQPPLAVDFVSTPIREEDGRIAGAVVVFNDVSDRRRVQEEQRRVADRLQELERLRQMDQFKTQFINTAAHELGTPLTPIRLQLHLLKKSVGAQASPAQKHALEILDRNVERLVGLVSDILDGARVQAGRLKVSRVPTDFTQVVNEAVESFHEPARHAGVTIASHVQPDLVVSGDANRLTQVLFNLLSNALKFTPAGGRIEVRGAKADGRVRLAVADTGAGLDAGQIARLFRPFSQVHEQPSLGRTGTGLGLYISQGIVELHEGQIHCASRGPGQGATFAFDLPLFAGPAAAPRPTATPAPASDAFDRRVRELI